MSTIIELQKYCKRKKLQRFLRFFTIISMAIVIGVVAYALIIMKRDHPVRVLPYIECKVG